MAAMSMKEQGKSMLPLARDMVTRPLSSGWRSVSSVRRANSGSSSRKSTPWCASEISPGVIFEPPPMSPTSEMVWCGLR